MKKAMLALVAGGMLIGCILNAHTRRDAVAWTDRGVGNPGNPSAATSSDVAPTLERFWNIQLEEAAPLANDQQVVSRQPVVVKKQAKPRMAASQTRDKREHHGYWGINLFNLIPVIDIVHGEVETESSDRVEGHR